METAKIHFSNGDTITTSINDTHSKILEYYAIGKVFNIGNVSDNLQTVVKCEILKSYRFRFIGRKVGAIGITYPITHEVEAFNESEAFLKLYDTYDHITGLKLL